MWRLRWLAIVSVLVLLVAACGRDSEDTAEEPDSGSDTTEAPDGTTAEGEAEPAELGLDDGAFGDLGVL
ncbi:MAG: hypothetical protein ABWZ15_05640, partial [Acidimicrobiia bacterium]